MKVQLNDIRHKNTWGGKEPEHHSPALDHCRKLLKEGIDPKEPLEVYRGEELAYTISSIGWGATKKIHENSQSGPYVIAYKPPDEKALARFALIKQKKRQGTLRTAI